jgi:hypothetical protein
MDPYRSALAFLTRGFTGRGGAIALSKSKMTAGQIAQAVQGSGFPDRYDKVAGQAQRYLSGSTGSRSGAGTAGSGGARGAFNRSQSAGTRASNRAVNAARSLSGPGDAQGYEGTLASIDLSKAKAEGSDNLQAMMTALYEEAFAKKKRLRRVNRALKRRLKKATRQRLTEERAQLLRDLQAISALFKEYSADLAGGATTISGAEKLDAGVDTQAVADAAAAEEERIKNLPTATDFANAAIAEAGLTPGLDDDIKATEALLGIATGDLNAARASGDPRRISEAIATWTSVNESLKALKESVTNETETRQRLIDATEALAAEVKTQNEFSRSVAGIATREAVRALADMISGEIVGTNLQGRRLTAGNGVVAITP